MPVGPSLRAVWAVRFLLIACGIAACGDDDTTPNKDAGTGDAGAHHTGPADAGKMMIPRPDAQVAANDPVPACDRGAPNTCPSGEVCDAVIRRAAGDTQYTLYAGCVDDTPERALGDPCDPDLTDGTPYSAPGLVDEVYRDPCGVGLICAPDDKVRDGASCQPLCGGFDNETPIDCASATALCFSAGQIATFCKEVEKCDVDHQKGCADGEACYLTPTSDGKQLLSLCSPINPMPTDDGAACADDPLACKPGSICLGPVHKPITQWAAADLVCRRACGGAGDEDAGTEDGGVGGPCGKGTTCEPYSASGLSTSLLPTPPYGQCE
jgi:hypothetical protein